MNTILSFRWIGPDPILTRNELQIKVTDTTHRLSDAWYEVESFK